VSIGTIAERANARGDAARRGARECESWRY